MDKFIPLNAWKKYSKLSVKTQNCITQIMTLIVSSCVCWSLLVVEYEIIQEYFILYNFVHK